MHGHNADVACVFVIKNDKRTDAGSNHSLADPTLMVIVFTPAGDAEFTFENVVLSREPTIAEHWGSKPYLRLEGRTSMLGVPAADDNNASIY